MSFARAGDTVVVHSMDRLARNLDDLRRMVSILTGRGVRIEFVKEHLSFTGDDSPMASLLLSVMGAFAEFERSLIRERILSGLAKAKRAGKRLGRKPAVTVDPARLRRLVQAKTSLWEMSRQLDCSRTAVRTALKAESAATQRARARVVKA